MTRTNLISTVIVGLASTAANAGLVYVNPTSMSGTVNSTEVGAKYRLSNSNWDMSLDNGAGTSSSSNFLSAGLGNNNQLSGRTYSFTLTHTAGQGFVFTMLDTASNAATTLSWGTFASPPGGTTAARSTARLRTAPSTRFSWKRRPAATTPPCSSAISPSPAPRC